MKPPQIPVFVLTGFLGAGKTTLLNRMVAGRRDTAVIVNEFGLVAVDHDLVRQGRERAMVTSTGCICCTMGSDLRSSLAELLHLRDQGAVPAFSRVIVETTGLADPAPILNSLIPGGLPATALRDHAVARAFRLSGVIVVVDVQGIQAALSAHPESLRQIAFADHAVLTHGLPIQAAVGAAVESAAGAAPPPGPDWPARLGGLNPGLRVHDAAAADFDPQALLRPGSYAVLGKGAQVGDWLAAETLARAAPAPVRGYAADLAGLNRHGAVRALALQGGPPRDRAGWQALLADLAARPGTLRLKGLLADRADPSRPLIAHAVGHRVHPLVAAEGWSGAPDSRLVVIATDPDQAALQRIWQGAAAPPLPGLGG